jgi:hypothetical protein
MASTPHTAASPARIHRGYLPAAFGLFIIVVLPYLGLHFYNHPIADDYGYAIAVFEHGFWGAQLNVHHEWSGRYTSTALLSFNPVVWHMAGGYAWFSLMNQLCLFSAMAFFLNEALRGLVAPRARLIAILGFLTVYISHLHSTAEGIYWLAGYVNYTVPITLWCLIAALYIRFVQARPAQARPVSRTLYAAAIGFLCFLLVGCNETSMFQLGLLLMGFIWRAHAKKSWTLPYLLGIGLVSAIGAAIVIASPGNFNRAEQFAHPPMWVIALKLANSTLEHFAKFFSLPLVFAWLAVAVWSAQNRARFTKWMPAHASIGATWSLVVLVIATNLLPSWLSAGGNPPRRADNMAYFFFTALMALLAFQYGVQKSEWWLKQASKKSWLRMPALALVFCAATVLWPQNLRAWKDFVFVAPVYSAALDNSTRQFEGSGDELAFEQSPAASLPRPATVFSEDPLGVRKDGANDSYPRYARMLLIKAGVNPAP